MGPGGLIGAVGHGGAGPGGAIHGIRFFVPALASIALLGAWPLARLPRWLAGAIVAAFFGLGLWSFATMAATDARGRMPGTGPGGMPGGFPGGMPSPPPSGSMPSGAPFPQGTPAPPARP